jgi:hypothetical protein
MTPTEIFHAIRNDPEKLKQWQQAMDYRRQSVSEWAKTIDVQYTFEEAKEAAQNAEECTIKANIIFNNLKP